MYKTDFCRLEMLLENDKQFEPLPNIRKNNKEKRMRTIWYFTSKLIVVFYIWLVRLTNSS